MIKNIKKIIIGALTLILLGGGYYFYLAYNTTDLPSYYKYCSQVQGPGGVCINDFIQKCKRTRGQYLSKEKCNILPPNGDCLEEAFSRPIFHYGCCYTNNICKCPFGKGWENEEGCKFF